MSNPPRQYEREEEYLDHQLESGEISPEEYHKAMRELRWDYQAEAQKAAESAYLRELEQWY